MLYSLTPHVSGYNTVCITVSAIQKAYQGGGGGWIISGARQFLVQDRGRRSPLVEGVGLVLPQPGTGDPLGLPLQQVDLVQQPVVRPVATIYLWFRILTFHTK